LKVKIAVQTISRVRLTTKTYKTQALCKQIQTQKNHKNDGLYRAFPPFSDYGVMILGSFWNLFPRVGFGRTELSLGLGSDYNNNNNNNNANNNNT
jgi:hypothetical protein